jgi:hypothetical protein
MNPLDNKDQISNPTLDNEIQELLLIFFNSYIEEDCDVTDPNFRDGLRDFKHLINQRELAIAKHLAFQLGYPEEEIIKYIEEMK